MNKSINKLAIRLLDEGKEMVDSEFCYTDYGIFGEGTVSHWFCLKVQYDWKDMGHSMLHEQLHDLLHLIRNDEIYKYKSSNEDLHKKADGHPDYILDDEGKPKNFNPFNNGTYRRRK
tara:strand:+ start:111 stop:461 length:351 start_codon:yes stop_codon:yes gene_type:complete